LDIWAGLVPILNQITAPCIILLQLFAQYVEFKIQRGVPGALSLRTLGLQVILFGLLGIRWQLRVGKPWEFDIGYPKYYPFDFVRRLYKWAFPAANYFTQALVCAFLWMCYRFYGRGIEEDALPESAPLLG
jgi:hypothetical protein